ncbi:hypothetical protein KCP69_14310 [Salmonella enterica subsp. enterica]|nr:hypothetical protein KCP69_14310 [Salmonella enterica subsp. enterica]
MADGTQYFNANPYDPKRPPADSEVCRGKRCLPLMKNPRPVAINANRLKARVYQRNVLGNSRR